MNNNIFQHNSSCVLGVTFSLTLEKAMVGDLGESLCLKKYWFCSLRKETLVSYYISLVFPFLIPYEKQKSIIDIETCNTIPTVVLI